MGHRPTLVEKAPHPQSVVSRRIRWRNSNGLGRASLASPWDTSTWSIWAADILGNGLSAADDAFGARREHARMIDLKGKTAVIFGLANKRSIAWGIAQKLHAAGATLAICYQNERMKLEAE